MIVTYSLGAFMSWNNIAYVGVIFPIIAFFLFLNSPESPVFLVSRGEKEKAEQSLKRLRPYQDVSREIQTILESLEKAKRCSSGKTESKYQILRNIHKYPNIYKPFFIVCFLR